MPELNQQLAKMVESINNTMNEFAQFFSLGGIEVHGTFEAETNKSKNTSTIKNNIEEKIEGVSTTIIWVITVINRVLSLSLLLLLFESIFYWNRYCSCDSFDNIYITKKFKVYDKDQKDKGKESVLPLKNKEKKIYIDTCSFKIWSIELAQCKIPLIIVLLHFCIWFLIEVFNFLLYYLLDLVNQYGQVEYELSVSGDIGLEVNGKGLVSLILKGVGDSLRFQPNTGIMASFNQCLPKVEEPDYKNLILLIFLYLIALLLVLLQTYGSRSMHKLASYYYPQQEFDRTVYLHEHILHKRRTFSDFFKQHAKMVLKKIETLDRIDVVTILRRHFPALCKIYSKKVECFMCGAHLLPKQVKKCLNASCYAVYCLECSEEQNWSCTLCENSKIDD